jgi:hypothetical protein
VLGFNGSGNRSRSRLRVLLSIRDIGWKIGRGCGYGKLRSYVEVGCDKSDRRRRYGV